MNLRDYQERAVNWARDAFVRGRRSVLLVSPTGSGKGTIAAHVMLRATERDSRCLFVVHRVEIVRDVAQRLMRAGCTDLCVWSRGERVGSPSASIHVAAIQTLTAGDVRPDANLIVWDEAHHCVASTYLALRASYPQAIHLLLTATPERSDRTALGDVAEELYVVASVRELTEQGHLVPIDTIAPPSKGDELAMDPLDAIRQYGEGRQAVVFADSVSHAKDLAARFGERGAAIDGSTKKEIRDATLARFARGELDAVFNWGVLTEGWDCPSAKICVLARGAGSAAVLMQIAGRILRPDGSGRRALLVDLCGSVHVHGLPDEDRVFSLTGKAIGAAKIASPWTCKTCWCVLRSRPEACPRCGEVAPPPPPPIVKERKLSAAQVASRGERKEYFDRLVAEVADKGWKPVSVGIRFKARFGHWPPWPIPKSEVRA
jgi:superfamily II DNA or RNA helicase